VTASRLAWTLCGLSVVTVLTISVINAVSIQHDLLFETTFVLFVIAFATVGALVAARQPRNPIGWLMCLAALSYALMGSADTYATGLREGSDVRPGSIFAAWIASWGWVVAVGLANTFLLLLYPTGRLPSRRWRPVAWLAAAGLALSVPGQALSQGGLEGFPDVENPLGIPGAAAVAGLGLMLLLLAMLASIASLLFRFRRAGWAERQQLKWLLYAAAVVGAAFVVVGVLGATVASLSDDVINATVTGAATAIPFAMGIAILRHGLYDIDLVINRTLVYVGLTAALVGAYVGAVLLLQLALSPLTEDSDLAIAGSTLAVAALVRPLRARIQGIVDRRFYRRRYDAARTLQSFGSRLRDQVELDTLSLELRGVVSETMQPAHVSLWLREAP
jgi:hypothetical protein